MGNWTEEEPTCEGEEVSKIVLFLLKLKMLIHLIANQALSLRKSSQVVYETKIKEMSAVWARLTRVEASHLGERNQLTDSEGESLSDVVFRSKNTRFRF